MGVSENAGVTLSAIFKWAVLGWTPLGFFEINRKQLRHHSSPDQVWYAPYKFEAYGEEVQSTGQRFLYFFGEYVELLSKN